MSKIGVMSLRMILLGGLFLRLTALFWYLSTHGWKGETWEYEVIANNLLAGKGFVFLFHGSVYRSLCVPFFPAICAALHWLGGSGLGLYYVFQLSCALGIISLTYFLTTRLFGENAAGYAGWLVALDPASIVYQSYKVDAMALSALLMLFAFLGFLRAIRADRLLWPTAAGLAAGLGMLTRPDTAAYLSVPLIWVVQERFSSAAFRKAAVIMAAAAFILTPWVIRNFNIHGRFIPTATTSGQVLWVGNNPNSTGTLWTRDGRPQVHAVSAGFGGRIEGAGELANMDLYRSSALTYITQKPVQFVGRCLRSFFYFWWFAPDYSSSRYYSWASVPLVAAYKIFYLVVFALALAGTAAAAKDKVSEAALLWAPSLALALIHSFNYVEGRHRLLILPFILILSGRGAIAFRTWLSPVG